MKLLIIGNDPLVLQALEGACRSFFSTIVACHHDIALTTFIKEDPSHIIINDYAENRRFLPGDDGFDNWQTLTNIAKKDQVFVRSGHNDYKYRDYIKLPYEPLQLRNLLLGV